MTTDILNKLDTFATLEQQEIVLVRNLMRENHVPKGEILFHEGDKGDRMYIVQKGEIAISINVGDGEEMEVSRIGEGSFFGEMSIIEQGIRSATCRAIDECILLSWDRSSFNTLIENQPKIAIKIMERMLNTAALRLKNTGTFLSDMVRWGEDARLRAITDEMTKLYNRRFFDEALKITLSDAIALKQPMSLVMLDIDKFGTLNKEYGEKIGDEIIFIVADIFRDIFDEDDILIRYGGDEFSFILPDKDGEIALAYCNRVVNSVRRIDILKDMGGSFKHPSVSIGIASYPEHGKTVSRLIEDADKALYASKEAGRNQATLLGYINDSHKNTALPNSHPGNTAMDNTIRAMVSKENFLISGHAHADGDCLFSMTAIAFALGDMGKSVTVLLNTELLDKVPTLRDICKRHSVKIAVSLQEISDKTDTLLICDTAKPSMLEHKEFIQSIAKQDNILVIEIDHHIDADREFIGNTQYNLIYPVASSCEIVACILERMLKEESITAQLNGRRLLSFDILESLIAGIDSDTKKGKLFRTKEEEIHYKQLFHALNTLPADESGWEPNMQTIARILEAPSVRENLCLQDFLQSKHSVDKISWVALDEKTSKRLWEKYDSETVVNVARHLTDLMAQESAYLGLVAYYDNPQESDLIQFRMRRDKLYKGLDLRTFITHFNIDDGGGHEGAVGFRLSKNKVTDFPAYINSLVNAALKMMQL